MTPCPIAVAPPGFADRPAARLRRIGVGFEPTPEGRDALRFAHCLAAIVGGELRVIGVVLPLAPFAIDDVRDPAPYEFAERREVVAGLRRAVSKLPRGVPTVVDARVGSPGGELLDASDGLDLLVCGSRRRGPLHTLLSGSVTERLVAEAACPLVIVPRPLNGHDG
jgi:nucleotide-binding universal stress UspA family protein